MECFRDVLKIYPLEGVFKVLEDKNNWCLNFLCDYIDNHACNEQLHKYMTAQRDHRSHLNLSSSVAKLHLSRHRANKLLIMWNYLDITTT